MNVHAPLCEALKQKVAEQIELLVDLLASVPPDRAEWTPPIAGAWTAGVLLGHLLDCLAGVCAVLQTADPVALAHFSRLRDLPVNRSCSPGDAAGYVAIYREHIEEGFGVLADIDLSRRIPTVFVPEGELLLTLLLGNLEHLINHKFQLFSYLKLLNVPVGSRELYRFRGE